jgi:hypothetical protein
MWKIHHLFVDHNVLAGVSEWVVHIFLEQFTQAVPTKGPT